MFHMRWKELLKERLENVSLEMVCSDDDDSGCGAVVGGGGASSH